MKGTVMGYSWANPHVMIGLNVNFSASGKMEKWDVGGPSTTRRVQRQAGAAPRSNRATSSPLWATVSRMEQNVLRLAPEHPRL